jgi:two-component system, cell cycle response regulator CpdR
MARILVAEDESAVREFVVRALRVAGHEPTAVDDGQQALNALAMSRFDLLLTDIVMPGLDGIALALKASSAYPDMRVLLMSGYAAERQRAHNLDALFHDVIAKPFSLKALCEAVDDTLAGRPLSPSIARGLENA